MDNNTFNPAEVLGNLKSDTKETSAETKPEKVEPKEAPKAKIIKSPTSEVKNEVKLVGTAPTTKTPKRKTTSSERAYDTLISYLDKFKNSRYGSPEKVQSLEKIMGLVLKYPKKIILDTILEFFVENKNAEFLDEYHALQGTITCDQAMSIKLRLFYSIMYSLAHRTATKKTISIDMVKNVFQKEDLNVWLTMQLRGRN